LKSFMQVKLFFFFAFLYHGQTGLRFRRWVSLNFIFLFNYYITEKRKKRSLVVIKLWEHNFVDVADTGFM
jgi:hypothetical protein